ncbi:MAG: ATP-binding cassette domain-containing protein [candidate division Zixibacteria bacterium]|nr:ATP-binding cassette domain-containing protein [candidate division Zixibacteria bacterium]
MISVRGVSKSYNDGLTWAVKDVSFDVTAGEVLALVGESGCGKTSTLKMINRLVELTSGAIAVGDRDIMSIPPVVLRRSIGYVIQEIGLFPHLTVEENIGVVPELLGWSVNRTKERVDELLNLVGLDAREYRKRRPEELSGGQQQRVGLARALAGGPKTMLMDEPFGALDPITRAGVVEEFRKIQHDLSLTVIFVTHDMAEALILADRIAVMKDGSIMAIDTPSELLSNPGDPYAEELLSMPQRQAKIITEIAKSGGEPL